MTREPRLISLASILVDDVFQLPHLPRRNGDVIASNNYRCVGGGFNILVSAKRLGLSSAYAGSHGQGSNSDAIRSALLAENIEVLTPPQGGRDSGTCLTLLEPDGARTFITYPGIESEPRYSELVGFELFEADFTYISGYDLVYPLAGPVIEKFLSERVTSQRIVFDPGPLVAEIPHQSLKSLLQCSAITSCNEDEYQFLVRSDLLGDVGGALVTRRGSLGANVISRIDHFDLPAPSVHVVDTTGAGDTHVGAMIAELALGESLERAVYFANVCAAISVTRYGPATGPTRIEVAKSGLYDSTNITTLLT